MKRKYFLGSQRLLSDPDPHKRELENPLLDDELYFLDLNVAFTGETPRSGNQLYNKLKPLFDGLNFRDLKVLRQGDTFCQQAIVDKENFLDLITHDSYGDFPGDYKFVINDFWEFGKDEEENPNDLDHDVVLLKAPTENIIDGMDHEITVTICRGNEPTDRPARGLQTFNMMADPNVVKKFLKHFKIERKITRVTKATPQRPTLQIRLTCPVSQIFDEEEYLLPCLIYDPTPQSVARRVRGVIQSPHRTWTG